jgi:OPA family glycerol-3-phosphate transporter-like MFS transporter/OPA family sugar phosphate sensor protein UhpC-like MFS transporter
VAQSQYAKWQWRALFGATFCYLFYYTGRQTLGFAVPGIQADFGFTKQAMGWISAVMLWGYAVGQSINGNLGDKFGGKRMMVMGAVLSFAANWAFSFANSYAAMLVIWCANGFAQSMGFAPGSRLLSNWWGHERRGFVYGIYVGFSGFSSVIAYALPILILGPLHLQWHSIFRIPVFLMLVGALTLWLFVKERPEDIGLKSSSDEHAQKAFADEDQMTSRSRYVSVLKSWKLYVTGISIGCQNAARYALIVWVPVHLLGKHWATSAGGGISPTWITLALPVGMALGAISNSWVSDILFRSRRYVAIIVYMLIAAGLATTMSFVAHADILGLVLMFLCGFFVFGPASSFWALCPDLFGRRQAGTATGLLNCMSYAAAGLGEPIIGHTMDVTGQTSIIFPIVAGLCLASAISAFLIKR